MTLSDPPLFLRSGAKRPSEVEELGLNAAVEGL